MIWAVGDIHGQAGLLRDLLEALEAEYLREGDRLVFVGDYVDRGPDTAGVVEALISLRERRSDTVFLRGNHDQMMLEARAYFSGGSELSFDEASLWFAEGGHATMASYKARSGGAGRWWEWVPDSHWRFLEETVFEHEEGAYLFVHAGLLPPGIRWDYPRLDPRLWVREPFISGGWDCGRTVVFGHTVQRNGRPLVLPGRIGIDTGAAYGGPLTAVGLPPLPEGKLVVVQAVEED